MEQTAIPFPTIPAPKNQAAHLLYDMIAGREISEQDYRYNRFRGYISDLRRQLDIRHSDVTFKNTFGRDGKYRKHYILSIEKDKAVHIYKQINR